MTNDGPRIRREKQTVAAMITLYCKDEHDNAGSLCTACQDLHDYAMQRLERCPFGEDKTTCAHCAVHCYKPAMRERVRVVMRSAGPRMMWRHPILAVRHVLDGRKKTAKRQETV
jgi:hypothetical protein